MRFTEAYTRNGLEIYMADDGYEYRIHGDTVFAKKWRKVTKEEKKKEVLLAYKQYNAMYYIKEEKDENVAWWFLMQKYPNTSLALFLNKEDAEKALYLLEDQSNADYIKIAKIRTEKRVEAIANASASGER
jgi:nitrogen regulatory protein PII-like uncharacterized protein